MSRLIPRHWRAAHRRYADAHGLFWLPCPICGEPFGGHEASGHPCGSVFTDPSGVGHCVCPACAARRAATDADGCVSRTLYSSEPLPR